MYEDPNKVNNCHLVVCRLQFWKMILIAELADVYGLYGFYFNTPCVLGTCGIIIKFLYPRLHKALRRPEIMLAVLVNSNRCNDVKQNFNQGNQFIITLKWVSKSNAKNVNLSLIIRFIWLRRKVVLKLQKLPGVLWRLIKYGILPFKLLRWKLIINFRNCAGF